MYLEGPLQFIVIEVEWHWNLPDMALARSLFSSQSICCSQIISHFVSEPIYQRLIYYITLSSLPCSHDLFVHYLMLCIRQSVLSQFVRGGKRCCVNGTHWNTSHQRTLSTEIGFRRHCRSCCENCSWRELKQYVDFSNDMPIYIGYTTD